MNRVLGGYFLGFHFFGKYFLGFFSAGKYFLGRSAIPNSADSCLLVCQVHSLGFKISVRSRSQLSYFLFWAIKMMFRVNSSASKMKCCFHSIM